MIDKIKEELDDVHRTLEIQFQRIAQLQASLDELRSAVHKQAHPH